MNKLASSLDPSGKNVRGYACDVASDESVKMAFESIEKDLGLVSTVVCNAATFGLKPIGLWTAQEITTMTDINASGVFRVAMASKPHLLQLFGSDRPANIVVVGAGAAGRDDP